MKYWMCVGFFLSVNLLSAQEENEGWTPIQKSDTLKSLESTSTWSNQSDSSIATTKVIVPGTKTINVDPAILTENEKYTEYSKQHPQIKGYTILLYAGSGANSRLKARDMAQKFEQKFEGVDTHVAWRSPNYEVRVGDYRTKIEAQIDLELVKQEFPTAFIKAGMIELPPLEKLELTPIEKED